MVSSTFAFKVFTNICFRAHGKILFQEASRMAGCFSKPSNSQHKTSAVVSQLLLLMLLTTWFAVFKYESLRSSSQRKFVAYEAERLLSQTQSATTRARISFNARAADEFANPVCRHYPMGWERNWSMTNWDIASAKLLLVRVSIVFYYSVFSCA